MVLNRIRQRLKERRLDKMRETALKYLFLIDTQMKQDGTPRAERRRFKRELINNFWRVEGATNASR